jgi:hypothetical protein
MRGKKKKVKQLSEYMDEVILNMPRCELFIAATFKGKPNTMQFFSFKL